MRGKRQAALGPYAVLVIERTKTKQALIEQEVPPSADRVWRQLRSLPQAAVSILSLRPSTRRVDKWIRDRLIDWPSTSCLHCRKPIIVGQLWAVVSNGEVTARFHEPCHGEWLAQQEDAARLALGLAP